MPRVVLIGSKPRDEHRAEIEMYGQDHFEYVMHDGRLFVKLPPCDRHDDAGRIHAYVQNPFTAI